MSGESATAPLAAAPSGVAQPQEREGHPRLRRALAIVAFLLVLALLWEGAKWLAGDPWRIDEIGYYHRSAVPRDRSSRTFSCRICGTSPRPSPSRSSAMLTYSLANYLFDQSVFTWLEAVVGFALGTLIGIVLASVFVHFGFFERAFVPYVVASQTVPIVALAPMIVIGFGRGLTSIVVIATYLTFFPVTIAVMRGLRSPDPRAVELMRSYAASKRARLLEGASPGVAFHTCSRHSRSRRPRASWARSSGRGRAACSRAWAAQS